MDSYYVNNHVQSNGDHEVHKSDCRYYKNGNSMKSLGNFSNCADAVKEAKKTYSQSNGCATCCPTCHTS